LVGLAYPRLVVQYRKYYKYYIVGRVFAPWPDSTLTASGCSPRLLVTTRTSSITLIVLSVCWAISFVRQNLFLKLLVVLVPFHSKPKRSRAMNQSSIMAENSRLPTRDWTSSAYRKSYQTSVSCLLLVIGRWNAESHEVVVLLIGARNRNTNYVRRERSLHSINGTDSMNKYESNRAKVYSCQLFARPFCVTTLCS